MFSRLAYTVKLYRCYTWPLSEGLVCAPSLRGRDGELPCVIPEEGGRSSQSRQRFAQSHHSNPLVYSVHRFTRRCVCYGDTKTWARGCTYHILPEAVPVPAHPIYFTQALVPSSDGIRFGLRSLATRLGLFKPDDVLDQRYWRYRRYVCTNVPPAANHGPDLQGRTTRSRLVFVSAA